MKIKYDTQSSIPVGAGKINLIPFSITYSIIFPFQLKDHTEFPQTKIYTYNTISRGHEKQKQTKVTTLIFYARRYTTQLKDELTFVEL